jgi:hypothetical protein
MRRHLCLWGCSSERRPGWRACSWAFDDLLMCCTAAEPLLSPPPSPPPPTRCVQSPRRQVRSVLHGGGWSAAAWRRGREPAATSAMGRRLRPWASGSLYSRRSRAHAWAEEPRWSLVCVREEPRGEPTTRLVCWPFDYSRWHAAGISQGGARELQYAHRSPNFLPRPLATGCRLQASGCRSLAAGFRSSRMDGSAGRPRYRYRSRTAGANGWDCEFATQEEWEGREELIGVWSGFVSEGCFFFFVICVRFFCVILSDLKGEPFPPSPQHHRTTATAHNLVEEGRGLREKPSFRVSE